jgi:hypothetical protein
MRRIAIVVVCLLALFTLISNYTGEDSALTEVTPTKEAVN